MKKFNFVFLLIVLMSCAKSIVSMEAAGQDSEVVHADSADRSASGAQAADVIDADSEEVDESNRTGNGVRALQDSVKPATATAVQGIATTSTVEGTTKTPCLTKGRMAIMACLGGFISYLAYKYFANKPAEPEEIEVIIETV